MDREVFTMRLAALILAAGLSSRMGAFKPLLPLGNRTVIEVAIDRFRMAGIDDIRVVVGHCHQDLQPILASLPIGVIYNQRYLDGMFTSVTAGISSIEPPIDGFFLLPVDNPLIEPTTIVQLQAAFGREYTILHPSYRGRRGHPPLFSASHAPGILQWRGQGGLRGYLRAHDGEACHVAVDDPGILWDMDTPPDYIHLLAMYEDRSHRPPVGHH